VSRIGKLPIPVPSGVKLDIQGSHVKVEGPRGQLERTLPSQITIRVEDGTVVCERPTDGREHRSLHGLTRTLLANMVTGVSATDGTSVLNPAVNQFENCLRCHGTSSGKQSLSVFGYLPLWSVSGADPLNVISQLQTTSTSSHPVMHDSNSALPQPSLLAYMWNLDGKTQGRAMGVRLYCTDCHNSDDNREFGGVGPNGPHGSIYLHLLERRYEFSQVAPPPAGGPGSLIQNLFPNPIVDPSAGGPYSLCAKCHDLNQVLTNSSFTEHARHINDGFSCSTCHTAHGMGAVSASISGERMVNFDINVVAPNGASPISYSRATNSCSLTCHGHAHSLTVPAAAQKRRTR